MIDIAWSDLVRELILKMKRTRFGLQPNPQLLKNLNWLSKGRLLQKMVVFWIGIAFLSSISKQTVIRISKDNYLGMIRGKFFFLLKKGRMVLMDFR